MRQAATNLTNSTHARLIAAKLLIVALLAIAVTELSIVANLDIELMNSIHSLTTGWLTTLLLAISELASTEVILVGAAAASLALAAKEHWRGAVALTLSVLATQIVVAVGKGLMSRPRPDEGGAAADAAGFSFPSAHSASAVALYFMLALIAGSALHKRLGWVAWMAAALLVMSVGLSRVYLGAHYPTDVLAGWLTGGIVVVACWALCARLPVPGRASASA
jgi:membrane-associated phospholipid phosphatase